MVMMAGGLIDDSAATVDELSFESDKRKKKQKTKTKKSDWKPPEFDESLLDEDWDPVKYEVHRPTFFIDLDHGHSSLFNFKSGADAIAVWK
jgi:hypothetical protein